MKKAAAILSVLIFSMISGVLLQAQETPFFSEKQIKTLVNEVSGDRAFEYIRWLSHFHRIMGSQEYLKAAQWIADKAKEFNLQDIRIEDQPLSLIHI